MQHMCRFFSNVLHFIYYFNPHGQNFSHLKPVVGSWYYKILVLPDTYENIRFIWFYIDMTLILWLFYDLGKIKRDNWMIVLNVLSCWNFMLTLFEFIRNRRWKEKIWSRSFLTHDFNIFLLTSSSIEVIHTFNWEKRKSKLCTRRLWHNFLSD